VTIAEPPVTAEIAQRVGTISGQAAENESHCLLRICLIGATALQLGFELATYNSRDFQMIPDLIVKEP